MQSLAQHEPWPPVPPSQNTATLGSYLEGPFQVAQGYCINGNPEPTTLHISKGWFHKQELSAISPQLYDPTLHLDGSVLILPDSSIGRVFSYAYTKKTAIPADTNLTNYLQADYLQDPATMAALGFDAAVYDYNCTASFAASLKLNGGWTFPIGSMASGLQSDAAGQTAYHLALVSGKFQSPIWFYFKSVVAQDQKTYAALLLWDWYLRNPGALVDLAPRYLLTDFDGVALYKVATTSFSTNSTFKASTAFTTGMVSTNAELQAAYQSSTRADVKSFGVVVRKSAEHEIDNFASFPTATDLANQLTNTARAHLDPKSTDLRLQTIDMRHVQIITGVPQTVCTGPWHAELAPGTTLPGSLSVGNPTYLDPAKGEVTLPSCSLPITYSPSMGVALPDRVDLDYYVTTELWDPSLTVVATAKFRADKVSLSQSGLPTIGGTSSKGLVDKDFPTSSTSGGITFFTYQWTLSYPITEDPASAAVKIASVALDSSGAQVTCGPRKISSANVSLNYTLVTATSGTMTLMVTHPSDDQHEKLDLSQLEFCNLDASVVFRLNNGAPVARKLPITQLLYPKLVQSVAPASTGPAGVSTPAPQLAREPVTVPSSPVIVAPQKQ
jgi:hypothetical protein